MFFDVSSRFCDIFKKKKPKQNKKISLLFAMGKVAFYAITTKMFFKSIFHSVYMCNDPIADICIFDISEAIYSDKALKFIVVVALIINALCNISSSSSYPISILPHSTGLVAPGNVEQQLSIWLCLAGQCQTGHILWCYSLRIFLSLPPSGDRNC